MNTFKSNTFIGQRIKLDGHIFDDNKFENCVLVYGGGPLSFSNNVLNGIRWEFIDDAARTIGLISSLYQAGGYSKEFVETLLATYGKQTEPPKPSEEGEINGAN